MRAKVGLGIGLGALLALTACNTVHGAGKDLESAGDAVSDASGTSKTK